MRDASDSMGRPNFERDGDSKGKAILGVDGEYKGRPSPECGGESECKGGRHETIRECKSRSEGRSDEKIRDGKLNG